MYSKRIYLRMGATLNPALAYSTTDTQSLNVVQVSALNPKTAITVHEISHAPVVLTLKVFTSNNIQVTCLLCRVKCISP